MVLKATNILSSDTKLKHSFSFADEKNMPDYKIQTKYHHFIQNPFTFHFYLFISLVISLTSSILSNFHIQKICFLVYKIKYIMQEKCFLMHKTKFLTQIICFLAHKTKLFAKEKCFLMYKIKFLMNEKCFCMYKIKFRMYEKCFLMNEIKLLTELNKRVILVNIN